MLTCWSHFGELGRDLKRILETSWGSKIKYLAKNSFLAKIHVPKASISKNGLNGKPFLEMIIYGNDALLDDDN